MGKIVRVIVVVSLVLFLLGTALGKDPAPPKKTPELVSQGKKLYNNNCVTCHGPKGDGKGQLGASLKPAPSDFTQPLKEWSDTKGEPKKVFDVITKGIPNSSMVKWDHLPEQERWALVYYVEGFAPAKAVSTKKK
jgi:mono/diheme cytochrome c family protein